MVELEKRGVWDGFKRSFRLVRGHFWMAAAVLIPVEIVGDAINEALVDAAHGLLGHGLLAAWVGESVGNIVTAPVVSVAIVLLTLDLIHHRDGNAPTLKRRPEPVVAGAGMSASLPLANFITEFWNDQLVANDRQGVFLVLVGFVGSFAFIRMSTRMIRAEVSWWPGNIESESGVHVHHLVFGIITMMVAGTLGFAAFGHSPLTEICAFFFGVGAGLTIDEFALWVYLEDVYWAEEGRSSIDATVIAAALIGLLVVGINPFEASDEGGDRDRVDRHLVVIIFFVAASFLKGRRLHGIIGVFFPPLAIYGDLPDRQAELALGAPPLRRQAPEEAGEGRRRASTPAGGPTASRKPSATSSAASRARA